MTWFGTVSAVAALLMGAMFGVNAYFQFATDVSWWIYAGVALLLIVGAFRTLRKLSGGLRLLCGAWGLAAGVQIAPWVMGSTLLLLPNEDIEPAGSAVLVALVLVPFIGLMLTVLHKETKA